MEQEEVEVSKTIISILPDCGNCALDIMAYTIANMLLSIDGADLGLFVDAVQEYIRRFNEQEQKPVLQS